MHLKDYFAAHLAAALAHRVERPEVIAARAYELADALIRERSRVENEEREAFLHEVYADEIDAEDERMFFEQHGFEMRGLLDEPAPLSESEGFEVNPAWLDRDIDARLDVEPHWQPGAVERPGLARTAPLAAEDQKTKKQA
jgi:hypothetical protein